VDRSEEHVGAIVEDVLGAVAVVVVHIQYRDALGTGIQHGLHGDGGVVQVAVAAHVVGSGVVSRWAAQGEDATGTLAQLGFASEGDVG
jgi:hypothetical protein